MHFRLVTTKPRQHEHYSRGYKQKIKKYKFEYTLIRYHSVTELESPESCENDRTGVAQVCWKKISWLIYKGVQKTHE